MTNTEKHTTKTESKQDEQVVTSEKPKKQEENKEDKKDAKKITKPKIKRTEAVVNSFSLPISTKYSIAISKFIKKKKVIDAITDLEQVIAKRKPVPMNNLEVPHKKGKGIAGARYPKKASEHFINLLKTLLTNAKVNEIDEPVISEVIANIASRPYGRFGRHRKKRTHIRIVATEKKINEKKNNKEKK